jgi:hypothetical protein
MIFHDLANPTSIRVSGLGDQKYFDVAIFWGPRFMPYRNAQKPLTELTPEQAGQHGRLYVATPTAPAVLLQTYPRQVPVPIPADTSLYIWGGVVPDSGVERMIRAGVPVRPSR